MASPAGLGSSDCQAFGCLDDAVALGVCAYHLRFAVRSYLEKQARPTKIRPERIVWTPEFVVGRIRSVAAEIGHVPTRRDWNLARSRPTVPVVLRLFGSWAAAVEAAGFTKPYRGCRPALVERQIPTMSAAAASLTEQAA